MPQGRVRGRVRWFNDAKGFGFITDDAGEDIFVHFKGIEDPPAEDGRHRLMQGDSVEFEVEQGQKGKLAVKVRTIRE